MENTPRDARSHRACRTAAEMLMGAVPQAAASQPGNARSKFELSRRGIHWDALDEDISLEGLLAGQAMWL